MTANLSPRVRRLLQSHGITTVEQIRATHPLDLLGIRGFGQKALREVETVCLDGKHYVRRSGEWPRWCKCDLCHW